MNKYKKGKHKQILCLLFALLLFLPCGCFTVTAADELVWTSPYSCITNIEFSDDTEGVTGNYANIFGWDMDSLYSRWDTTPTTSRVDASPHYDTLEATHNQQLIFYQKTYTVGIAYWNTYGHDIMDSINRIKDIYPDKFDEYSKEWKDNFQSLRAAMRRGDKILDTKVIYENIADNNRAIADCTDEFNTAISNLKELQQNLVVTDNEAKFAANASNGWEALWNLPDSLWNMIGLVITNGGNNNGNLYGMSVDMIATIANAIKPYIVCLAYLVWITAFALEIKDSALRFEISEPRGIINIFVNLIIGKVSIDISIAICLALLKLINMVSENILSLMPLGAETIHLKIPSSDLGGSTNWWNLVSVVISDFPSVVISICCIVCMVKMIVKVISRNFQLGCLLCVAPLGFAAIGGDRTLRYFEKFLTTFLSVAFQIIAIAIVYVMASHWIFAAQKSDVAWAAYTSWVIMFIVAGATKVVVKPPKQFEAILG